jgi:hypothetical protein
MNIVTLVFVFLVGGCTTDVDDQASEVDAPQSAEAGNPAGETSDGAGLPLRLGIQNYIVSADRYDQGNQYENPDAALVRQLFEETDWNDPDVRPIFRLVRPIDGRFQMLQVRRNQTEAGEYHVAWAGFTDGQTAEGESTQIDSPDKLLEMLLAFLNDDPQLRNLIEWDDLDVQPVD